jgi:hypothetical protein
MTRPARRATSRTGCGLRLTVVVEESLKSVQTRIGAIPVLGYLLKVVHDIVMLPVIRRHLLEEIRHAYTSEIEAIEQRIARSMTKLEGASSQELRGLEQHITALAAFARKATRDQAELRLQLEAACERIAALEAAGLERPVHPAGVRGGELRRSAHG